MKYLALSLLFSFGLSASKIEFRNLTLAEGFTAAKEEGKPVFIDCFTTWCGPCKWMSANIFTDEAVAEYYNDNYICLKIDMEKGEGIDIAKNYSIRAYPTLLYLDDSGETLLVSVGANREPQSYIDNGNRAKDPENNIPYFLGKKNSQFENPAFMSSYFSLMSEANMLDTKEVDRYFSTLEFEQWLIEINWRILMEATLGFDNVTFQTMLNNSNVIKEEKGEEALTFISDRLYQDLGQQFYGATDEEGKKNYLENKTKLEAGDYLDKGLVLFRLSLLEHQKSKDWDNWGETAMTGVKKYYWNDANALNNAAWTAFENVKDEMVLPSAVRWAQRAVELSEQHHIIDTYAHLLAATGQKESALEQELRAFNLAQAEGASTASYQEFIDELNQK
jgi:thiol-disulfide isomerase/thioredoxin